MTNSVDPNQLAYEDFFLFLKKPTDLDLHCFQKQGISGFSRKRVKYGISKNILHFNALWYFSNFNVFSIFFWYK